MAEITPAHDESQTIRLWRSYPAHEPRTGDVHYRLFNQTRARMKRQGLLGCVVNNADCGGRIELHHTHVEFAYQNLADMPALNLLLGLNLKTLDDFASWVEGYVGKDLGDEDFADLVIKAGNLEPLCVASGTPVLMADGSEVPVETVRLGDRVVGHDGGAYVVTGLASRFYDGMALRVGDDGPVFTHDHRLLTPEGWRPVGSLASHDLVYRMDKDLPGLRAAPPMKVQFRVVDDRVAHLREGSVAGGIVLGLATVPVGAVYLEDDVVGWQESVGDVLSDCGEGDVQNARLDQCCEEHRLQVAGNVPYGPTFAVVVIEPHARPGTPEPTGLALLGGDSVARRPSERQPAGAAVLCPHRSRAAIEQLDTARVRAGADVPLVVSYKPLHAEDLAAHQAFSLDRPYGGLSHSRAISPEAGSRAGGGRVPHGVAALSGDRAAAHHTGHCDRSGSAVAEAALVATGNVLQGRAAAKGRATVGADSHFQLLSRPQPSFGRWEAVQNLHRLHFTGIVYDLEVSGCHSFIAGGIVAHNCQTHHTGLLGVHLIPAADWDIVRIHKVGVQPVIVKDSTPLR